MLLAGLLQSGAGCTFRLVNDTKYRLDEAKLLDSLILRNPWDNAKIAADARLEIERLAGENRSLPNYERLLASLHATCRRTGQGIRCSYIKQERWTSSLLGSRVDQYEYEIRAALDRKRQAQTSVCFGSGGVGALKMRDLPEYHQPFKWRCSPTTVVSDACKGIPRGYVIHQGQVWDCGP